jgi:hypothetical protein
VIYLKMQGFKVRLMTWRAKSDSPDRVCDQHGRVPIRREALLQLGEVRRSHAPAVRLEQPVKPRHHDARGRLDG